MRKIPLCFIFFLILFINPYFIYSQRGAEVTTQNGNALFNLFIGYDTLNQQNELNRVKEVSMQCGVKLTINDYLIASIDSVNYQLVSYFLVVKKADPNYCNELGITPLMAASIHENTDITKLLINKGAKINYRNFRGENALQWAIIGQRTEQLKLLIDNKSEINFVDINGISPLFYALGYNAYDLTNNTNDIYNKILARNAPYSITKDLIKTLIESGANINQADIFDCTPLLFVTFQNDAELIKILCEFGADPNKPNKEGITPLFYAIQDGHYRAVEQLIKNGAMVNYKLSDGNMALFAAVKANNDSIAALLIRNKALVNETDSLGLSPLHYASGYGFPYMANLLVNSSANINLKDIYGNSPLMTAIYSGAKEVTKILINAGADVNITDNKGNTPLMIAAQFNDTALIKILYLSNADINLVNSNNFNSLSFAIENNSVEAFKLLSDLGAKIKDSSLTKSYYQQAIEVGSNEISSFLTSKGQKTKLKPNINGVNIYTGFTSSENDFMVDFGGGIYEPITKVLINIGFKYRLFANPVISLSNSSFNKILEKRNSVYFSLQHLHILKRNISKGNIGLAPGLSNEFTWRYYEGLKGSSTIKWIPVPSFGLYYQKKLFTIIGKWEVKYTNQIKISNRFNLQLVLTIPTNKRVVNKRIDWLE